MALTRINNSQLDSSLGDQITTAADPDLASIAAIDDSATGYLFKSGKNRWEVTSNILGSAVSSIPGSGATVQTSYAVVEPVTSTAVIPLSVTAPAYTSGIEIWRANITPTTVSSKIKITGSFIFTAITANTELVVAVFRNSECIGVTVSTENAQNTYADPVVINFIDTPESNAMVSYSIRAGTITSTTWFVNRFSTEQFGGLLGKSVIEIIDLA